MIAADAAPWSPTYRPNSSPSGAADTSPSQDSRQ